MLLVTVELRHLEDLEIAWSFRRNWRSVGVLGFIASLEPKWLQL